jgi:hypothetical protein
MREKFKTKKFKPLHWAIICKANEIIEEYQRGGFTLTLRQLYYQFVSRDYIPNSLQMYNMLGDVISEGRMAGEIDWSAIEDRGRNLQTPRAFLNPTTLMKAAKSSYQINPWLDQPNYVEVWVEKEALLGVLEVICEKMRVPYFACKGYNSQSEMYAAGKRFAERIDAGKKTHIIHLGDHDPSGIDMTRDIRERMYEFSGYPFGGQFKVHRIALNKDQVEEFNPPPNPAKFKDPRANKYISEFGESSWELDALPPTIITALIHANIHTKIDKLAWDKSMRREKRDHGTINKIIKSLEK